MRGDACLIGGQGREGERGGGGGGGEFKPAYFRYVLGKLRHRSQWCEIRALSALIGHVSQTLGSGIEHSTSTNVELQAADFHGLASGFLVLLVCREIGYPGVIRIIAGHSREWQHSRVTLQRSKRPCQRLGKCSQDGRKSRCLWEWAVWRRF